MVACAHSHSLQGFEIWGKGVIFYGLGNFLFSCFGGKPGRPWPRASRETCVASCTIEEGAVIKAGMRYFFQDGLVLVEDNRPKRARKQERLNRTLNLPDGLLNLRLRLHILFQVWVVWPIRFIRESGGIIAALGRIRRDHVIAMLNALGALKGGRPEGKAG